MLISDNFNLDILCIAEVQRVMEDRVPKLLEKLLEKPSLSSPPSVEEGGLLLVSSPLSSHFFFS